MRWMTCIPGGKAEAGASSYMLTRFSPLDDVMGNIILSPPRALHAVRSGLGLRAGRRCLCAFVLLTAFAAAGATRSQGLPPHFLVVS
jgi:hypothetical protein